MKLYNILKDLLPSGEFWRTGKYVGVEGRKTKTISTKQLLFELIAEKFKNIYDRILRLDQYIPDKEENENIDQWYRRVGAADHNDFLVKLKPRSFNVKDLETLTGADITLIESSPMICTSTCTTSLEITAYPMKVELVIRNSPNNDTAKVREIIESVRPLGLFLTYTFL